MAEKKLVVLTRDRANETYPGGSKFEIDPDTEYLTVFGPDGTTSALYTRHHWSAVRYVEAG